MLKPRRVVRTWKFNGSGSTCKPYMISLINLSKFDFHFTFWLYLKSTHALNVSISHICFYHFLWFVSPNRSEMAMMNKIISFTSLGPEMKKKSKRISYWCNILSRIKNEFSEDGGVIKQSLHARIYVFFHLLFLIVRNNNNQ